MECQIVERYDTFAAGYHTTSNIGAGPIFCDGGEGLATYTISSYNPIRLRIRLGIL